MTEILGCISESNISTSCVHFYYEKFVHVYFQSLSYIAGSCIASGQYGSFHVSGGLRDPKKVFGKVYMQMTAFQHGSSCELSDYETVKKLGHMNCMHVVSLQGV